MIALFDWGPPRLPCGHPPSKMQPDSGAIMILSPGRARALILFLFCALPASTVEAACTDSPAPGVVWTRCLLNERDLRGVALKDAVLRGSSFIRADLSGADLSGADGRNAKFVSARLETTRFAGADLKESDFTSADMTGADLRNADLSDARFYKTVLRDADLTGARLNDADILRADFSGALWTDGKTRCAEGSIGLCR